MTPTAAAKSLVVRRLRAAIARRRHGFTLTEVMIALALVSLLLVGISRVFALTSATIGTGQALSSVLRTQRSVQQVISNDFIGVGPDIANPALNSGMAELVNADNPDAGAPFLMICNFRVPTYLNQSAMAADVNGPGDTSTAITSATWGPRSLAIRGVDLDGDGAEANQAILAGGEITPLYWYGDRNFRCDAVGFFTRGSFRSQTGSNGRFIDDVTSNEAFTWLGHLRVYNSVPLREFHADGNGTPGDWLVPGSTNANRNNRFAEQFRLGRFQTLLVEPTDHDGVPGTASPAGNLQDRNTVTLNNDPSQPVYFAKRNWWDPTFRQGGSSPPRPTITPINLDSAVQVFVTSTGQNASVNVNPVNGVEQVGGTGLVQWSMAHCRTDIAGAGMRQLRARTEYVQRLDLDPATPPTAGQPFWWESLPASWRDRYYVNPFPSTLSSASMSRRQQLLADGVSQFIVEFAGDFVTQDPGGGVIDTVPDNVTDFVVMNGNNRVTRWYGMPRDVDGDGNILTTNARYTSPDVLPVRDFAPPATANTAYSFEKRFPPTFANYGLAINEPTGSASPNESAYTCAWGPVETESPTLVTLPSGATVNAYPVPQLIRIVLELRDLSGKLQEPQTIEMVYPVPIVK